MSATVSMLITYVGMALKGTHSDEVTQKKALRDSSWADGLRGVAACFVVSSHLVLAFARHLVIPCYGENGHSDLFQKPFFRLVAQGPFWVALFFILSGFVNALKPIKAARAGNIEIGLSNLAISSFRRSFRLFLPATAATIISWAICQLGAYTIASKADAYWLYMTSPKPSTSWETSIEDLVGAIRGTWTYLPNNPYDQPQWALIFLLQGSMMVFMALLVTMNLTASWRMPTIVALYFMSFNWSKAINDPFVGSNVCVGILLAELSHSDYLTYLARFSPILSPPLAVTGLYLGSFPSDFHTWAPWTRQLLELHHYIAPSVVNAERFWPTIGAQILAFSIIISPHLRRVFSLAPLLWLGKISFPLYLLHGTFMRTILSWMLYGNEQLVTMQETNNETQETTAIERYPAPGLIKFAIAFPVWVAVLIAAVHLWANKVEPWFGWMTKRAEDAMFRREDRPPALPTSRAD